MRGTLSDVPTRSRVEIHLINPVEGMDQRPHISRMSPSPALLEGDVGGDHPGNDCANPCHSIAFEGSIFTLSQHWGGPGAVSYLRASDRHDNPGLRFLSLFKFSAVSVLISIVP